MSCCLGKFGGGQVESVNHLIIVTGYACVEAELLLVFLHLQIAALNIGTNSHLCFLLFDFDFGDVRQVFGYLCTRHPEVKLPALASSRSRYIQLKDEVEEDLNKIDITDLEGKKLLLLSPSGMSQRDIKRRGRDRADSLSPPGNVAPAGA